MVSKLNAGNPDTFGIRVEVKSGTGRGAYGEFIILLGGMVLGTEEDEGVIGVTLTQLEAINSLKISDLHLNSFNHKKIYQIINNGSSDEYAKFKPSLGENFDDFSVVGFEFDSRIHFVWKLNEKTFFDYGDKEKKLNYFSVSREEFVSVLSEVRVFLRI